jgi:hypothetical protein
MQDVGLACLSPGFQTQDPTLREQLQRSISVRDQQRSIIEARLLKTAKGDGPDGTKPSESNVFGNGPPTSSKKRPPPGLSIVPPSAEQFANERVIQSAPLNQTFTGRHQPNPMTRHIANQPSNLSHTSHIHHVPAMQTNNRLPPISDVFGSETLAPSSRQGQHQGHSASNSSHSNNRPPFPSPGIMPHTAHPTNAPSRPREFRSAEEAVHEMTGGREELLPRIVHYGGHQPPTPPSPPNASGGGGPASAYKPSNHQQQPHQHQQQQQAHNPESSSNSRPGLTSRRRSRHEYEGDSSPPPLGSGRDKIPYAPFGAGRDSPESTRKKKEEFLGLCARAWDLFHT